MAPLARNPLPTDDWREVYSGLDLRGGEIEFFSDDGENMITIRYKDGMLVVVGRSEADDCYHTIVVPSDDERGWSARLSVGMTRYKKDLPRSIQETISRARAGAWWEAYSGLDLRGGKIEFIFDDDEDMVTIKYEDGMLIDVGRSDIDHRYYVTVVTSDDEHGWGAPLDVICLDDKKELPAKIQEAILRFRPI